MTPEYFHEQITHALEKAREGTDYVIGAWELEEIRDCSAMNIVSILREIEIAVGNVLAVDKHAPVEGAKESPEPIAAKPAKPAQNGKKRRTKRSGRKAVSP